MYCSQAQFVARFGQDELTQLLSVMSGTDRTYEGAADDADALINTYVVLKAPAFPLDPVPVRLAQIAADVTRWMLYDDRPSTEVQKRYDLAIADLKAIASGEISFPEWNVSGDGVPMTTFGIDVSSNPKIFNGVHDVMGFNEVPAWRRS